MINGLPVCLPFLRINIQYRSASLNRDPSFLEQKDYKVQYLLQAVWKRVWDYNISAVGGGGGGVRQDMEYFS